MNDMNDQGARRLGTRAVWAGEERKDFWQRATQTPVVHSVTYGYRDMDEWRDVALARRKGHIYSRNTNPTVAVFEEKMRALEGAEAATSFSTGMAAISNTLYALLSSGDRVVSVKDTYGGTNKIFLEFAPRVSIDVALCDTTDHESIEAEIAQGCRMLYLESPTNPTLKIMDLERLVKAAHQAGALVVVDNTFATPFNQNPLELGADLVLHSATKFLGGHADAMGGVVCGPEDLVRKIYHYREINGASLDPTSAYLLLRGLKTLHLRVGYQNESAIKVARFLQTHSAVDEVFYPGLEAHQNHDIARRQMRGFGGVLSFTLKGSDEAVWAMVPELQLAHAAASFGSVETTVGPPSTTSHVESSADERREMGIPEGLIRYSVGVEDTDDLIADLEQALQRVETGRPSAV